MASSDEVDARAARPTKVRMATAHYARSPNRGFAVRRYGLHTRYWRLVMRTHPIVCPVPYRKSARLHESAAQLASAKNGWPIDRNAGPRHIGASAGLMSANFSRRPRRAKSELTQIVEIDSSGRRAGRCAMIQRQQILLVTSIMKTLAAAYSVGFVSFALPMIGHSQAMVWDFQQGTASIAAGSKAFVLSGISLNPATCIGEYISIYGAESTILVGRPPNGGTAETRYAPLTTTIVSCSDSTHGTTAVAASRTVTAGGTCPPTSGTTAEIPFSDGCTRVGHDVSAGINAAFQTQGIVTLPTNGYGFAANSINIDSNHEITGSNTHIYNGWAAGYSPAYPAGLNTVNIIGTSHGSRVNNAKVIGVFLDNGLDFNWNMLGNGEPAGIYISYASDIYVQNSTLSNMLRGVAVLEDGDTIVLSNNSYYNNHEDSEHFGESYVAGDSVSNVTSSGAHLYGYSDDGIAVVGGALPCANSTSTGNTAVTNVVIENPVIAGSDNPGGGRIYNCAIQLAGNLNGVQVLDPTITHPGYCSIAVEDYGGGAPQNVFVSGGTVSFGTTAYPQNSITSSPIVLSSQAAANSPACPAAPATGIQFDSMAIDAGGNEGITVFDYGVSSVRGACFSVTGNVNQLWFGGNTCHNDTGAVANYGVWLGPGSTNVTIQNNTFNFVGNSTGSSASELLYNGTSSAVDATGNEVNYNYQ